MTHRNQETLPPTPLDEVIAEYLLAVEAGAKPDTQEWIRRHPEVAEGLRAYFADQVQFDRAAAPLNDAMATQTAHAGSDLSLAARTDVVGLVRYFGDYQLLDEIDRGGMGVVFKARQVSLGRTVALKMILSGQFAGLDDIRRFRDEASAAAGLDHPNIVPIYEIGEHEGRQYFSMKLIEGSSLRREMGRFDGRAMETATLMLTVARAVQYAHQRGLIHRDLKPANILLDAQDQPHVTDFGLAKRFGPDADANQLTQSGAVMGTPAYMSPEQAAGRPKDLTTASDVYSLGAILYEMLTGRPPFAGETPLELLTLVKGAEPTSLRRLKPNLPRDLETICLKCLQKEPQQRYATAEALADDLQRWLKGEPIVARKVSQTERLTKWARRKPSLAALLVVCIIAPLVVIALLSWSTVRITNEQLRTKGALQAALQSRNLAEQSRRQAEHSREVAEQAIYPAQTLLAQSALNSLQLGQAKTALDSAAPALRGWEWRYLNAAAGRNVRTIPTPQMPERLRFSTDGQTMLYATSHWNGVGRLALQGSGQPIQGDCDNGWGAATAEPIPSFAVTPDLKLAAAQDRSGIYLWNLETDRRDRLGSLPMDANKIPLVQIAVAFSPDKARVYFAGNSQIACWDVAHRVMLWSLLTTSKDCLAIAISDDGKRMAFEIDNRVRVMDLDSKAEIFSSPPNYPRFLQFVDDAGTRLVVGVDRGKPQLWDVPSKAQHLKLSGDLWGVITVLSEDRGLAATGMATGEVIVWETLTGKVVHTLKASTEFINVVALSRDGTLVASGGRDRIVRVWDVASGDLLKSLVGHSADIVGLDFSPDGKSLASGAQTYFDGIKLWDMSTPATPFRLASTAGAYWGWTLLPDGHHLVAAGQVYKKSGWAGIIDIFDLVTGRRLSETLAASDGILAIAGSPDGSTLLAAAQDGSVRLFDLTNGTEIRILKPAEPKIAEGRMQLIMKSAAFAPDGKSAAVGTLDGWIISSDIATGRELWRVCRKDYEGIMGMNGVRFVAPGTKQYAMRVVSLKFVHGNDWLMAVGEGNGAIATLYDARTGRQVEELPPFSGAFAFSPDNDVFAFANPILKDSDTIQLIDLKASAPHVARSIAFRTTSLVKDAVYGKASAMTFSPDAQKLAVGDGPAVDVYDVSTGALLTSMQGHESMISALAWLPDASRLISGSLDHTAIVWDPHSGQQLLNLPLGPTLADRVEHLLITPDGSRVIGTNAFPEAGSGGNTIMVWGAPK